MWKSLNVRLVGATPLLMHNGQLADPLNPFARAIKEVAARRRKSDSDHEELGRLEFLGGLWLGEDGAPCLPGEAVEACIIDGARKSREGKQASATILVEQNAPLLFCGPRSPAALWADKTFCLRVPARVGAARVMRTRPKFTSWSAEVAVQFNTDLLNQSQVLKWLQVAGEQVGLGDWRPRFGRFSVEV